MHKLSMVSFILLLIGGCFSLQAQRVEIGIRNCFDTDIYVTYRSGPLSDRLCVKRIAPHRKQLIHLRLLDDEPLPDALCALLIDFKISSGSLSWFLTEEVKSLIQRSADGWNGFAFYVSPAHDVGISVNCIRYPAPVKKKRVRFATV